MSVIDTSAAPVPPAPNGLNPAKTETVPAKRKPYPERVAARAESIRFTRVLLSIFSVPWFVLGFIVGVVWAAVRWCIAATVVGFETARLAREEVGDDGPR